MTRNITTVDVFQTYLKAVREKAGHHAQTVEACLMALAGAVALFKDAGSDLKVLERDGDMKNVLWVNINGQRYAFVYNHNTMQIEVRKDSMRGTSIAAFDDKMSLLDIYTIFKQL
jgi:hypothetical protein